MVNTRNNSLGRSSKHAKSVRASSKNKLLQSEGKRKEFPAMRLLQYGMAVEEKREKLRRMKEENNTKDLNFHPSICKKSESIINKKINKLIELHNL